MEQLHPVLPTQEQLKQWEDDWHNEREHADVLLIQAFQAGADAELEACCEWVDDATAPEGYELRAARRPKPPSLKQQACNALRNSHLEESVTTGTSYLCLDADAELVIRRALKALPD
jgi:hypothetical protein